jgi:hypothetical protein
MLFVQVIFCCACGGGARGLLMSTRPALSLFLEFFTSPPALVSPVVWCDVIYLCAPPCAAIQNLALLGMKPSA